MPAEEKETLILECLAGRLQMREARGGPGALHHGELGQPVPLGGAGAPVRRLYQSAILDLCDRRIVAFTLRDTNDTTLFQDTLDQAIAATPNAHPLFHNFQVPYFLKEQSSVNLRYTGIIPLT